MGSHLGIRRFVINSLKAYFFSLVALVALSPPLNAFSPQAATAERPLHGATLGSYFSKKEYVPKALPKYEDVKPELPSPIYDDDPLLVDTYWKAWQLAFNNFHEPAPGSGYVSQFIDAAFNQNIFLWDSSFMTMFCNFGSPLVPGISTLDNFYAKQHEDGEIPREIVRATGADFLPWVNTEGGSLISRGGWPGDKFVDRPQGWPVIYKGRAVPTPNPQLTLDNLDHPILAWAELESYRVTGNKNRLESAWEPLVQYYRALQKYLRQGNGLYMTDWASMDNSPRNQYLKDGGTGVDISSEMVLFARNLAQIGEILQRQKEAKAFSKEADTLSKIINKRMWDKNRRFYFDLTVDGKRAPVKTVAAYWTLIARVAPADRANDLAVELKNPKTFGRPNVVPTLAADEPGYDQAGGYWKGSVWAPTTTMVIRGLETYGHSDLARQIALQHLNLVAKVYQKTGTIWENYSPEVAEPGKPAAKDFVGWSGIGPIMYLLEYGIGLRPDASRNELLWELKSGGRRGCDRFRFNGHTVSLVAEPLPGDSEKFRLTIDSDGTFGLKVTIKNRAESFSVKEGRQQFTVGP